MTLTWRCTGRGRGREVVGGDGARRPLQPRQQLHAVAFTRLLPRFFLGSLSRLPHEIDRRTEGGRPGRAALQSPNRVTNGQWRLQLGAAGARQLQDY
jgi:hypothetical protein